MHHLLEFNHEGEVLEMKATHDSIILFGHATPFREPFVAYGPFVMNTKEEIMAAYDDFNNGKFGNEDSLMN
jgi:redox-sensitive bicupin YhaK (pirin superfamily)